MRIILAVMLLSLMLTGSIVQTYEHSVKIDGSSVIEKEMDTGLFLGMLEEGAEEKIETVCTSDAGLRCTYSDGLLTTGEDFSEDDGYYSFEVTYGIPYVEYEVTVKKIPTERFTEKYDEILLAAGLINKTSGSYGLALNIQDRANNIETLSVMKDLDIEIGYVVVMPGDVATAAAGEVDASIEGSNAEFMLSDVLNEAQPIVVKSREINWGYITVIVTVIVLAAFALSFRKTRKKGR